MKLLIAAAPMVSRGGVYSWLHDATPILRESGASVGVLWSARVEADPPQADWQRRVGEGAGQVGRLRGLSHDLRAAVADFAPDQVLSVLPQSDLACARALRGAVPWTAMVHGRPYPGPGEAGLARRLLWREGMRWAYRHADRIVAVSGALAETLREELGAGEVSVVHNGVRMPPDGQLRPRRGRTVGFLGRLSTEKAPDVFVEAVRGVSCKALVFGDGPLRDSIRARSADISHLSIEGWADREAALAQIDLLVLCSRREAFGLSCVEAGALEIPVLARDVGGVGEIFAGSALLRRHCLLPPTATAAEFGSRLSGLLDDPELRVTLARELRETVSARFALPERVLELERLLLSAGQLHG